MKQIIEFEKVNEQATIPTRGSRLSIGMDLYGINDILFAPRERKLIKTGLKTSFPPEYYLRIAPRSGLAFNHGIDVLAGVVDYDYEGEIGVILLNTSDFALKISQGTAIAQAILERADILDIKEWTDNRSMYTADMEDCGSKIHPSYTKRGTGAMGSTDTVKLGA